MNECAVHECATPRKYKLYCDAHQRRLRLYGDPLGHAIRFSPLATPEERFWDKVRKSTKIECWLWTGSVHSDGYGLYRPRRDEPWYAHRWSYTHFVGPIPDGLVVDHLCRVRRCVNPEHLEPVTHAENIRRSPIAGKPARVNCRKGHRLELSLSGNRQICRTCAKERRASARAALEAS